MIGPPFVNCRSARIGSSLLLYFFTLSINCDSDDLTINPGYFSNQLKEKCVMSKYCFLYIYQKSSQLSCGNSHSPYICALELGTCNTLFPKLQSFERPLCTWLRHYFDYYMYQNKWQFFLCKCFETYKTLIMSLDVMVGRQFI